MKRFTALFLTFIFLFACVSCRRESEKQAQTSEATTVSTVSTDLTVKTSEASSTVATETTEEGKTVSTAQTTAKPKTSIKNTVKSTAASVISAVKTTTAPKKRPQRTTVRTPLPTSPSTTAALSTLATTVTIASTLAKTTTTTERTETYPADTPAVNPTPTKPQKLRCTVSIDCSTILNNMDKLKSGKEFFVPADGKILKTVTVEFEQGETVFDILKRACANNPCSGNCQYCQSSGIQLEYSYSGGYGSYYVEGIHQIYEKDCGSKSGWMFKVNGVFPNLGCSSYTVKNGDKIEWLYTCDLGEDIGAEV